MGRSEDHWGGRKVDRSEDRREGRWEGRWVDRKADRLRGGLVRRVSAKPGEWPPFQPEGGVVARVRTLILEPVARGRMG